MLTIIEESTKFKSNNFQLPDENHFNCDGTLTIDHYLESAIFVFTPESYLQVFNIGLRFEAFFQPSKQFSELAFQSFNGTNGAIGNLSILENGNIQYQCFINTEGN